MRRHIGIAALCFVVAITSSAQMHRRRAVAPSTVVTPEMQSLWNRYQQAVFDSSVYQRENVRPLFPLRADANGDVLVATLTSHDDPIGPLQINDDIWVTAVPELQTICRAFTVDLDMKLRQLIGLPPDDVITHVLVMRVHAAEIFRPSPAPDPTTKWPCADATATDCGNAFPATASATHQAWIASSFLRLHAVPNGYPWTHLGYTYNWAPGADRYGTSEYIVPKNTPMVVVSNVAPATYCASAPQSPASPGK